MDELTRRVEAVLFATDTPLTLLDIVRLVDASRDETAWALGALMEEYSNRQSAIEVCSSTSGYILQVRPDYHGLVRRLVPSELTAGPLRTLSVIAASQPVLQSEITEMRGWRAYEHIKLLVEMKLVQRKAMGRTYELRTTHRFARQFNLSDDPAEIRKALQGVSGLGALLAALDEADSKGDGADESAGVEKDAGSVGKGPERMAAAS